MRLFSQRAPSLPCWLAAVLLALLLHGPCAASPAAAASTPSAEAAATPVEPPADLDASWETAWHGQKALLDEIRRKADSLSAALAGREAGTGEALQPYIEDARRLMVLANTFKDWPNPMEAVDRRIMLTVQRMRQAMAPLTRSRAEVQTLLERVSYLADSLPDDLDEENSSDELRDYGQKLTRTRLLLMAAQSRFDFTLAPSLALVDRLEKLRGDIGEQLPLLWKNYYLQNPLPWLSLDAWKDIGRRMAYSLQGMELRLPVEIPVTPDRWGAAALRGILCLLVSGLIVTLLHRRLSARELPPAARHSFRVSLPWLCAGLTLLGSAFSASGEVYRLFLALGNLSLIVAQTYLAWDLRLLRYPEVPPQRPPFWPLIQPTLCSYVLLYLPLTQPLVLVLWLGVVVAALVRRRRRPVPDLGPLHAEAGVLDCEPLVLWLCLLLTLGGLHIYSMVLYLLFVSCSLAVQLSLGGMALVSRLNENLPKEGARAALAHLGVALAAPLVLVAAVLGVSQWVGTLPGGMYLLRYYVFKGVNLGATQFNILHVLLIITMFYLTRAAAGMGSRFLARLPGQGVPIDATIIPPLQTAFTYALWCGFGLFSLRALGMELSNLAMVAGGLSVGIGFGMQTIVNNFLSGLILIFSRTLQAGDVVEVGGVQGRVRKISVRATMVETFDNALIIVPNSEFIANRLINWTRNSRTVRRAVSVGVAYGTDTALVAKLLLAAANAHSDVLKYPTPVVTFENFGDSTLDFTLRFWVKDFDVGASTASELRMAIEKAFREHGIEVAFPQMDLHVKELPARAGAALTPRSAPRRHPRRPRAIPARPRPQPKEDTHDLPR